MQITIKNRWTGAVIYECEADSLRSVVIKCVNDLGIDLSGANLRGANLSGAAKLGLGRVGWHSFRRTNATMTDAAGMSIHDRMKILGHGSVGMTNHYSSADLERARAGLGQVARGLGKREVVQ